MLVGGCANVGISAIERKRSIYDRRRLVNIGRHDAGLNDATIWANDRYPTTLRGAWSSASLIGVHS